MAVAELLDASAQLLRRLRLESNPSELTWSQIAALTRLANGGPMTTADLARADGVKPQSMGATLAALEQEGLIERGPDPADGRQILFHLTELGVETRRYNRHLRREWLRAGIARFTPKEQRAIIAAAALMKRLVRP